MTEIRYKQVVVDASVIIGFLTYEPEFDTHKPLLKNLIESNCTLIIPSIFYYEIINVLKHAKKLTEPDILSTLQHLSLLNFKEHTLDTELMEQSIKAMYKYNLSFYDATYASLAKIFNTPLFTFDKKLRSIKSIKTLN